VLAEELTGPADLDGIAIHSDPSHLYNLATRADVIVAQLGARGTALRLAARTGHPLVYWFHIGNVDPNALYGAPDLTVFTSEVVRSSLPDIAPSLVVHPPIDEEDYRTTPGTAVTLVNLSAAKGAGVLLALARRMPEREFLGVRTWGEQAAPDPCPPNVRVVGPVEDMRGVFARTRVLLVPSQYEAYGRVALEAAVSGIPTVAHPSAGLSEAMGDSALWAHRGDLDEWERQLVALDDEDEYALRSRAARARFESLDETGELDALELHLRALAGMEA
jgi:glycosyltransferase involved in cell wall biosynthesis